LDEAEPSPFYLFLIIIKEPVIYPDLKKKKKLKVIAIDRYLLAHILHQRYHIENNYIFETLRKKL